MRIALLTSSYPRFNGDGTAPFIKSIAQAMVQLGHQVAVVAPFDPACQPMDTGGVSVHRFRYVPFSGWHMMGHARALAADVRLRPLAYLLAFPYLVMATWNLENMARIHHSEVIYAHWVIPNGPPAAWVSRRLNIPL